MSALFNMAEVFTMAIQMESNGAAFYRRAAELRKEKDQVSYLLQLAGMEEEHKRIFEEMRDAAVSAEQSGSPFDLYDEGELYLAGIAGGHRVEGSPAVAEMLTGEQSISDIIKLAVQLEKQAILFYIGLLDVVPQDMGREQINHIIEEEKKHIVVLASELKKAEETGAL